jgi:hypothetical protein
MLFEEEDYLAHYGTLHKSGRYPWGSTNNVNNGMFADHVRELFNNGFTEAEVARAMGMSVARLRAQRSIIRNEQRQSDITQAQKLKDKGYSNVAIGRRMNKPESTVRALLAPGAKDKTDILFTVSKMLKDRVDEAQYIDVGSGVEQHIGITNTKLKTAVAMLEEQGYTTHTVKLPQLGTGKETTFKILAGPGVTQREVFLNRDKIQQVNHFSNDGGRSVLGIHSPIKVNPNRVSVNYREDGGDKLDGVIYVRPGVEDVSLGEARYAQVRIAVGDNHYLKGMAMYKDDLPAGVDLQFNTNKSKHNVESDLDAMKQTTGDPDNPFGANIARQLVVKDDNGNETVTSAMNIVNEEGSWSGWSRTLSSQMLSKQSPMLAKTQLAKTADQYKKEFEEIKALTNPTLKRKLLQTLSDTIDSSAVHLEAATTHPDTSHHVILPVESMSESEIYAPGFKNGTQVVLIRYPHGGTFEIPRLTVNNNQPEAKALLGNARDAVGIHHTVAERLSGADFDGDTVTVIPDNNGKIKTSPSLEGLKNFDPIASYPGYEGMPKINKQKEMGSVSNLITDMTIQGASSDELARAVRHSMVVIDAEKHNLNYRESARANGIAQLKAKYQGGARAGASTLISRANAELRVDERIDRRASEGGSIDPVTGERRYTKTGRTYTNAKGETVARTTRSKRLAEASDANTLVSDPTGTPIERVYADHSNTLKSLANQARLEVLATEPIRRSSSAAKTYEREVASLKAHLDLVTRNRPLERQAVVLSNVYYRAKRDANPNLDDDQLRKLRNQALNEARARTGAQRNDIVITPSEYDAIQAGAISNSVLTQIIDRADLDNLRQLATPRTRRVVTPAKLARAHAMMAAGATRAEVASALGIALGTLDEALYGGG